MKLVIAKRWLLSFTPQYWLFHMFAAKPLNLAQFSFSSLALSSLSALCYILILCWICRQFGRFLPPDTLTNTNHQISLAASAWEIPEIKIIGVVQRKLQMHGKCLTSLSFICSLWILDRKRQSWLFETMCFRLSVFVCFLDRIHLCPSNK